MVTDHGKVVIDHWYDSRPMIFSRPALRMVGRPYLPAESDLTAAEGKQGMSMQFKANVCPTTLLIILMTQRRMALDPRATNHAFRCMMAQEIKLCILVSNEMQTKTNNGPNLHHNQFKRQGMHAKCNLSMQAKHAI